MRHNETLVSCANAHARLSGAWKWTLIITELNQSVAVKSLKVTSVQTRMRMIKLLRVIMKTPIELLLDGITVGRVTSFGYETPWATGKVDFDNADMLVKLAKITSTDSFWLHVEDLQVSEEEEERLWEEKLSDLKLTWEDLKLDSDERWSIITQEKEVIVVRAPKFYENGFMDWRM